MKTETLEALLIDRALGALSPEVGELLELHLTQNPDAARQADRLTATVQLARTAAAASNGPASHLPPLERVRKSLKVQRRQAFAWELSRLAACLLLGSAVGLFSRSGGGLAGGANASAAVVGSLATNEPAGVSGGRNKFWSLANFTQEKSEPAAAGIHPDSRYRLHWDSPVKLPQVEENL